MGDWKEEAKADHKCACTHCDPSLAVSTERVGSHHIAVRFWEDDPRARAEQKSATIMLNGEPVRGVFEALVGEQGTIWRYRPHRPDGNTHQCLTCMEKEQPIPPDDDGRHEVSVPICTQKLTGRVEMEAVHA